MPPVLDRSGNVDALAVAASAGALIIFAVYHGISRDYLTSPDPDIIYAYQALLINDGRPQEVHAHTAYVYIVFLAAWTKVLAILGVIAVERLSDLPSPDQFEPAFAQIVLAGRWLSLAATTLFAWIFYRSVRNLTGCALVSLAATILLATSAASVVSTLFLRPEIWAMMFIWLALHCLLLAIRSPNWRGIWYLGCASFFSMIGVEAKLQVIPLALSLPVIALAFQKPGPTNRHPVFEHGFGFGHWAFVLAAFALTVVAATMFVGQIWFAARSGGYQALIVIYVLTCAWVYGIRAGLPSRDRILGLAAIAAGVSLGQLSHMVTNDPLNTLALANFIEHLAIFSSPDVVRSQGSFNSIFSQLPDAIAATLASAFWSPRGIPFVGLQCLYWSVLGLLIVVLYQKRFRTALQSGVLLGIAFGMEVFCQFRGMQAIYLVFVVPWLIAALGLLATDLSENLTRPSSAREPGRMRMAAAIVVLALMSINIWDSSDTRLVNRQSPESACNQAKGYLHRLPGYFSKYCS